MKLRYIFSALCVVFAATLVACGGGSKNPNKSHLEDAIDSVSYIVGMNVGYNILKMDSTLRAEAVVKGINDVLSGKELMSVEDARNYFLAYMTYDVYDRVRGYEEQFLADLEASDNKVQRTQSGLAYKVLVLGDMNKTATIDRDTVAITYRVTRLSGEEVDVVANREDTVRTVLRDFMPGVKEGIKLIGQGGQVLLWVPSELAYGSEGDKEKSIRPNEMLHYDINLLEVKSRRRR